MMGRKLKIGHVGTLDPCASGVLPILIGKATRLQDYLLDGEKIYVVEAEFGYQTDTLDFEGEQVAEASFAHISRELIEEELPNMIGEITQTPPIFSLARPHRMDSLKEQRSLLPLAEILILTQVKL